MRLLHAKTIDWKSGLLALLMLAGAIAARGQKIEIRASATELTTDDVFELSVVISEFRGSQVPYPQFPQIAGMQVGAPSSLTQNINGRVSVTFGQSYYPAKPGSYKVPEFSYTFGSTTAKSKPMTLKVKKSDGKPRQNAQGGNVFDPFAGMMDMPGFGRRPQQEPLKYKSLEADYFMSVNLDKDACYLGEQVHGDVVLYINERDKGKVQVDGMAIAEMQQRVKNTGFWQEIIELKEIPTEIVQVNGKRYIAYTLYKTVLFPIKSGDIEFKGIYLDGMKLAVAINASPITRFMRQDLKYDPIKIKAADRRLVVKPLPPTNLPDANMVGKFVLDAHLNTESIKTGENLELEVKIGGNGNMAMMSDPKVAFPESFEQYEPTSNYTSAIQGNAVQGEKVWKWSLLPTRKGDYDLGPIRFYYFDPARAAYDSLVVPSLNVRVTGDDIENQRIGKSGQDAFYDTAMAAAATRVDHNGGGGSWVLVAGALAMAGVLGVAAARRRGARTRQPEQFTDDYWGK